MGQQEGGSSAWETLAQYVRSGYSYQEANLDYEIHAKQNDGYRWKAGFQGKYSKKLDEYYLPTSTLKAENLFLNLYGKRNFALSEISSLLTSLQVGYNANLKGVYNYSGSYAESPVVTEMYANDILYLASDYLKLGAEICFSTLIRANSSLFLQAKCQYYRPYESAFDKRIFTDFSVGITF